MKLQHKVNTNISIRAKLIGRMKLGAFFALPEKDFSEYVKEVEKEEIFQELLHKYRIVRYRKFPGIKRAPPSVEFKEALSWGDNFDLKQIIQENPRSWQIVRKIALKMGKERFSQFLKGTYSVSFDKISEECGLSTSEAEKFKNFIDDFQLQQSFFGSDISGSSFSRPSFFRIACIENQEGELFILPVGDSTYLVKGRYIIDYKRWENLIQDKRMGADNISKISTLFRKLEMINRRVTTLYQILCQVKEKQHHFLLSADPIDMVPLRQREVARALKVNPSTISRAIANKSIVTPWGEEKALGEFFAGGKEKVKALLLKVIEREKADLKEGALRFPLSDEGIKERLRKNFGFMVARRTVTKYRKELRIPSSRKRRT